MNGAQAIAEILRREGTGFLSCYPRNPLIEACAEIGIRPILCRQERVGVGLADGYSRIHRGRRNGVFAAQAGPGIENAFPGIAQAYTENVPMLILPAGQSLERQYRHPTFDAAEVYAPVTKWSARAHAVAEVPELMRRAFQAMRTGKGGPVLVEIPAEVWEEELDAPLDYEPVVPQRAAPDPAALAKAAEMLAAAENPVLWAGQGVLYAGASDATRGAGRAGAGAGGGDQPRQERDAREPPARLRLLDPLGAEDAVRVPAPRRPRPRGRLEPDQDPVRPLDPARQDHHSFRPTTPTTSTRTTAPTSRWWATRGWCWSS